MKTPINKANTSHNDSSSDSEVKSTMYNKHPRPKHDKFDVACNFLGFYSDDES